MSEKTSVDQVGQFKSTPVQQNLGSLGLGVLLGRKDAEGTKRVDMALVCAAGTGLPVGKQGQGRDRERGCPWC